MTDRPETLKFYRRRLPHWHVAGKAHFVTFRLHGSLPQDALRRLQTMRTTLDAFNNNEDRQHQHRRIFAFLEQALHRNESRVDWLQRESVATIVRDSLLFAQEEWGWRIPAYVIMPNHIHCLFVAGEDVKRDLSKTLRSIKGYSALHANRELGRTGQFWQDESFDHWCRSVDKEDSVKAYIRDNPVKAGLVKDWQDWRWTRFGEESDCS